ncbi:MAG: hypothetical protein V4621_08170 [Pseudomonadota bacterium]
MSARHTLRILAKSVLLIVVQAVLMFVALLAFTGLGGCAASRSNGVQTVVTDSTTRKQLQRLVAVAVPGDSSTLTTSIQWDEATGRFKPVTIYSHSAHGQLAFALDAYGLVTVSALTAPWTAQVPVTDTEVTRNRTSHTTETVTVAAPLSRFVKFCIGFTVLAIVLVVVRLYLKFK